MKQAWKGRATAMRFRNEVQMPTSLSAGYQNGLGQQHKLNSFDSTVQVGLGEGEETRALVRRVSRAESGTR